MWRASKEHRERGASVPHRYSIVQRRLERRKVSTPVLKAFWRFVKEFIEKVFRELHVGFCGPVGLGITRGDPRVVRSDEFVQLAKCVIHELLAVVGLHCAGNPNSMKMLCRARAVSGADLGLSGRSQTIMRLGFTWMGFGDLSATTRAVNEGAHRRRLLELPRLSPIQRNPFFAP